ncbi:MAG: glycosyltransferase [bacterium]|nr:glycosyltransferase [bacterium]
METRTPQLKGVTIAIFVHNEITLFKRTLKSLRKNTAYPYHLIIVDDGCNKKTADYLHGLCKTDSITLIRNNKQRGYAHCANILIDHSKTPYILFPGVGAYVTKGWLSLLTRALEASPAHGIAGPANNLTANESNDVPDSNWSLYQIDTFAGNLFKRRNHQYQYMTPDRHVADFCYCFKRELVDKIGYFDEVYRTAQFQVIDYGARAAAFGYKELSVCGAYVHRRPPKPLETESADLVEGDKIIYRDKFARSALRWPKKVLRRPQQFKILSPVRGDNTDPITPTQEHPLVSCIMPTSDRPLFVPGAIRYFLRQDYPNKELIILDDGQNKIEAQIPSHPNIRYFTLKKKLTVGEKRNIAIEKSRGDVIMHWDDDDYYADCRISYQVRELINGKADLCALIPGVYYDINKNTFWLCRRDLHERFYHGGIIGGSMAYKKEIWKRGPKFSPLAEVAEDALFLKQLPRKTKILKIPNQLHLIYIRHTQNTWRFTCGEDWDRSGWKQIAPPKELPAEDLAFYRGLHKRLA